MRQLRRMASEFRCTLNEVVLAISALSFVSAMWFDACGDQARDPRVGREACCCECSEWHVAERIP
ncbi:MAG TPA: hypothetical protein VJR89_02730 [Polyangiales bacterium]|nr:hypothetical protein [Polyangiales bacterium]